MANVNAAFGLVPYRDASGRPFSGQGKLYYLPASDSNVIKPGDPVILAGSADADGVPSVTIATAAGGNYILGPVIAVDPVLGAGANGRDSTTYRAASTERYVWVADDPNTEFLIQEDAVGGALAAADVGLNADLVSGTGTTIYGQSGWQLDTSTKATTNTLQLKILGFARKVDNEIGANAKVRVKINLHALMNTTGY